MRRALGLVIAICASIAVVAAPAQARRISECGTYTVKPNGRVGWTFHPGPGATGVGNLTTRGLSCRAARRFALGYRGTDTYFPRWRCREVSTYESVDVRCTASRDRVIHWQGGS